MKPRTASCSALSIRSPLRCVGAAICILAVLAGASAVRAQTDDGGNRVEAPDDQADLGDDDRDAANRAKAAAGGDEKGDAGKADEAADEGASVGRAAALLGSLTVFVLAVFVGFEIITKVPPTLHTPLMSGSNAISGITIVGALLVAGGAAVGGSRLLGFLAVTLATINVVGGFLVTHRMLAMFKKR